MCYLCMYVCTMTYKRVTYVLFSYVRDGCTCVYTSICMNVCTYFTHVILNWVCKLPISTRFVRMYLCLFICMFIA
jgi:hypothetical protein